MRRMHRSAVRGSALARVLECDMRSVSCGFVSLVSAESTSSWSIRSVAEHGWFGSGHRESQCSFGNSRLGFVTWDLGFGIWDLLTAGDDSKVARASRTPLVLLP